MAALPGQFTLAGIQLVLAFESLSFSLRSPQSYPGGQNTPIPSLTGRITET